MKISTLHVVATVAGKSTEENVVPPGGGRFPPWPCLNRVPAAKIREVPRKDGKIVFGMSAVKNVGGGPTLSIIEARKEGPFKDFFDFCSKYSVWSSVAGSCHRIPFMFKFKPNVLGAFL